MRPSGTARDPDHHVARQKLRVAQNLGHVLNAARGHTRTLQNRDPVVAWPGKGHGLDPALQDVDVFTPRGIGGEKRIGRKVCWPSASASFANRPSFPAAITKNPSLAR